MQWLSQEEERRFRIVQRRIRFPRRSTRLLTAQRCGHSCCVGLHILTHSAMRRSTHTTPKIATMTMIVAEAQDRKIGKSIRE